VRGSRVWRKVLGVQQATIDGFSYEGDAEDEVLVIDLHPTRAAAGRCSRCDRRCRGYDQGGGVRRWRALDLGTTRVFLQAPAPRVSCREHGVLVAALPWARPGARFTRSFEDTCAWLTARDDGDGGVRVAADHLAVGVGRGGPGDRRPGREDRHAWWAETASTR